MNEAIIRQVEYYFGDVNLPKDKFLQSLVQNDDGWVTIDAMLKFRRLATITTDIDIILSALKESSLIEVDVSNNRLRRKKDKPLPEFTEEYKANILSRTVYCKGFSKDNTNIDGLLEFFSSFNGIENIKMRKYQSKLDKQWVFKGSVLILFDSKDSAEKFLLLQPIKYQDAVISAVWWEERLQEKKLLRKKGKVKQANNASMTKNVSMKVTPQMEIPFPKGVMLHLKGFPINSTISREDIKNKMTELNVQPAFIEFKVGDSEGWIRLSKENSAIEVINKCGDKLTIKNNEISICVMENEEEESYLQKARQEQIKMRAKKKSKRSFSSQKCIPHFETLNVKVLNRWVYHVELNRPQRLNSMNLKMWNDISECFQFLNEEYNCRSIILSGSAKQFSAGIDLNDLTSFGNTEYNVDTARKSKHIWKIIKEFQNSITNLEKCMKPIIACIHGCCIGSGVGLICAADIRYCSQDAWFQIKETEVGLAADIGTLQRLPKIIKCDSLCRELAYTSKKMMSDEALSCGFVSKVFSDYKILMDEGLKLADQISHISPVAVQGTKFHLVYSRDHSVQEGLDHMAAWNMAMLQTEDIPKSLEGMQNKNAEFEEF